MRTRCISILIFFGLSLAALLSAQSFPEDEIKFTTRPYILWPPIVFRAPSFLVESRVVVRDEQGRPVGGLRESDFQIFDNGKSQVISTFSVDVAETPNQPGPASRSSSESAAVPAVMESPHRMVALFFDDDNMPLGDLVPAREAAKRFVSDHLRSGDRIGVFTSSQSVSLDFSDEPAKLLATLEALRPRLNRPDGGAAACPRISAYQAHLILNMNDTQALDLGIEQGVAAGCLRSTPRAIQASIVRNQASMTLNLSEQMALHSFDVLREVIRHLGSFPAQRVLVLTSSGFLTRAPNVQLRQSQLIDAAIQAHVVINSLDARGLVAGGSEDNPAEAPTVALTRRPDLMAFSDRLRSEQRDAFQDPLAVLAQGSGGTFFHNNNDMDRGIRELASPPEVSYLIGFTPQDIKADGSLHALKVRITRPDHFKVASRIGYLAPKKTAPTKPSLSEKLDSAVTGMEDTSEVPVEIVTHSEKLSNGESVLRIQIRTDVRTLPFESKDGRRVEKLRFVTALFNGKSEYLAGVENIVDMNLKEASYARLVDQGMTQNLTLQAPPGTYRLRLVAQEQKNGRMTSLSRPVEIPQ
ncbi:MAG: VWA domain-containing protein [Acidobacteria bacterium]|nr:VWA domain-containing protein [Acidobacteriota bacterium]